MALTSELLSTEWLCKLLEFVEYPGKAQLERPSRDGSPARGEVLGLDLSEGRRPISLG